MKKLIVAIGFSSICSFSHAGVWDSITGLFSDDEEKAAAETSAESAGKGAVDSKVTSELINQGLKLMPFLVQQLNVSEAQAGGGMGALLQAAMSMLSGKDSKTLLAAIPQADKLLAMAPALSDDSGGDSLVGGALKAAGKLNETVASSNKLVSQFEALGMGPEMIPQFSQTAQSFLDKTDHSDASALLSDALSGFLK